METQIKVEKKIEITKEDFEAYEDVRISGMTNMYAFNVVCDLSGLSKEKVRAIMENYNNLMEAYPEVRE